MTEQQIRTLIVDDESGIRFFLSQTLERAGHVVTTAANGEQALAVLRDTPFELVLLDLKLGGRVDGLRVLEAVRWRWPTAAVIILTAHGSLESAMDAIREGVDRYLLKPLTPQELREAVADVLARREQRLARTTPAPETQVLEEGPFRADLRTHEVWYAETLLELTSSEFALLTHLMRNAQRVAPVQELVQVVRDYQSEDLHEARQIIRWYIHTLRRKIEPEPSTPRHLINVRGVGYRFVP